MRTVAPFVACLTIACGGGSPEPAGTAGGESASNRADDPTGVALVSPGEGERALLRYDVAAGVSASALARIEMVVRTRIGGQDRPPQDMPVLAFRYTVETTERVGDAIRCRVRYDELTLSAGSDPELDARLSEMMAPLRRATADAVIDARGGISGVEMHVPADLTPEMRTMASQLEEALRQLVPPLPEEPVAIGAVWTDEGPVQMSTGLTLHQRATYRLVSRAGSRIELALETEAYAEPGPLPGAESATLLSLTGRGSGSLVITFDSVVPESSSTVVEFAEEASLRRDEQTMPMHLDVTMRAESTRVVTP
jgi:hypothetical protein